MRFRHDLCCIANKTICMQQEQSAADKARETVLSFISALNEEDFDKARSYVNDGLVFKGVLGTREGAEAYFNDMRKMKLKYQVQKAVAGEDTVAVFYDIDMGTASVFAAGCYELVNGKIDHFRVVFDPRPVLQGA